MFDSRGTTTGEQLREKSKRTVAATHYINSTSMAALQVVQLLQALAVVWREAWARKAALAEEEATREQETCTEEWQPLP